MNRKVLNIISLVLVCFTVLSMPGCSSVSDEQSGKTQASEKQQSGNTTGKNEAPTEGIYNDSTDSPTEISTENDYQKSCQEIDYKTLARDPNKYKGQKLKVSGEVAFIQESSEGEPFRIKLRITKNELAYSDTAYYEDEIYVYGNFDPESGHIIDYDIITVWGECEGLFEKKVFGETKKYPCIRIEYYSIDEPITQDIEIPDSATTDPQSEADFKQSCIDVDGVYFDRFSYKLKDKNIKIKGKVYYVKETDNNEVEIQILTIEDQYGYSYHNTALIHGTMQDDNRILTDDIITVWGKGGDLEYSTNYAAEPIINMKYYSIE